MTSVRHFFVIERNAVGVYVNRLFGYHVCHAVGIYAVFQVDVSIAMNRKSLIGGKPFRSALYAVVFVYPYFACVRLVQRAAHFGIGQIYPIACVIIFIYLDFGIEFLTFRRYADFFRMFAAENVDHRITKIIRSFARFFAVQIYFFAHG